MSACLRSEAPLKICGRACTKKYLVTNENRYPVELTVVRTTCSKGKMVEAVSSYSSAINRSIIGRT